MLPYKIIKNCMFLFILIAFKANAQKTPITEKSLTNLINNGILFKSQLDFNAANSIFNRALVLSKSSKAKKSEAIIYDQLAEIALTNNKYKTLNTYDSLLIPIATQLKDTALLINAYNRKGLYLANNGDNKKAEQNYNLALAFLALNKQQDNKAAEINSNLGSVFLAIGEKDKAITRFYTALKLYEKNANKKGMGETYSNISSIYYLMGNIDDAVKYQLTSIEIREKIDDKQGLIIANINIGQLYLLKKTYTLAKQHLTTALNYAEQLKNIKLLANAYAAMSVYEKVLKNYTTALQWQGKAIKIFEDIDDKQMLSRLYVSAGGLAGLTKDTTAALFFFNKAVRISLSLNNKENISNAYEKLSAFYFSNQNFERAYDKYKSFILYRDSIIVKSNLAKIAEVKIQYETEKKDNEISKLNALQILKQLQIEKQNALISGNILLAKQKQSEIELLFKQKQLQNLKISEQGEKLKTQALLAINKEQQLQLAEKEKLLKERQIKNQKKVRNFLIAGFAMFLLLAFTFFNRYQLKKKLEQQTALLAIRNNISKDLHDEVGSTLTSINILSNVSQQAMDNEPQQAKKMLQKISTQSKAIQQSMSDIVWSIQPNNEKIENLVVRMREFGAQTLEPLNIKITIQADDDLVKTALPIQHRKELLLIYKEAINNIVKHAQATIVLINIQKRHNQILFSISDNGTWKGNSSGTGIRSMQERAKAINGNLIILNNETGTHLNAIIALP